jgi:hypothetical protein
MKEEPLQWGQLIHIWGDMVRKASMLREEESKHANPP